MATQTVVREATLAVGAADASAAPLYFWQAPTRCVIKEINLICSDTIAAHATDIMTVIALNLLKAGAGTAEVGRQTVDSDVTGYVAVAAKIPWNLILSTTLANLEVAEGDVLQLALTEGGTATTGDLTNASFQIKYQPGAGLGT